MSERTVCDVFNTFAGVQRDMAYYLIGYAMENDRFYLDGNGDWDDANRRRLRAIYRGLNDEQRMVLHYLIAKVLE